MQRVAYPNNGSCTHRRMHKRDWISALFTRWSHSLPLDGVRSPWWGTAGCIQPFSREASLFCHTAGSRACVSLGHYPKPSRRASSQGAGPEQCCQARTCFRESTWWIPPGSQFTGCSKSGKGGCPAHLVQISSPNCIPALPNTCVHCARAARI